MDTLKILLKGATPLLMSNPAGMGKPAAPGGRKVIPTPEAEAEERAYKFPDGTLGFPAVGVRNSFLGATKGRRQNKIALGPVFAGAILPTDHMFPFVDDEGNAISEYVIDTQRVVIKGAGIMRSRPRLDEWNLVCTFNYNREVAVDLDVIEIVAFHAGLTVGIGDYRIANKGWYGSYTIRELQVLDSKGEITEHKVAADDGSLTTTGSNGVREAEEFLSSLKVGV